MRRARSLRPTIRRVRLGFRKSPQRSLVANKHEAKEREGLRFGEPALLAILRREAARTQSGGSCPDGATARTPSACRASPPRSGERRSHAEPEELDAAADQFGGRAAWTDGWSAYFGYGSRLPAYRAVDHHVHDRVRHFLARRHKEPGRGVRRFPYAKVFGDLGVSVYNACKLDRRREPYDEISRKAECLNRARPV